MIRIKLLRTAKIDLSLIIRAVFSSDKNVDISNLDKIIKDKYKLHSSICLFLPPSILGDKQPSIDFFSNEKEKIIIGIVAMAFDIEESNSPQSGILDCDPINQDEINRLDGTLLSEIQRITEYQAYVYPKDFIWKVVFENK